MGVGFVDLFGCICIIVVAVNLLLNFAVGR